MPKPTTNFKDSSGTDLGSVLITKEYLSSVYPQIDGGQMQVWGWGLNGYGVLGVNDTNDRSTPVQEFTSSTNWKQVDTGGDGSNRNSSAAVKSDGTLWTWGNNIIGQLGVNDATDRSTPIQVGSDTTWKQVSTCGLGMAAVKTDGTLWAWGQNSNGQLGVNDTIVRSTPVQEFSSSTNWKQVSVGPSNSQHTAAIKTDGTLWTWGDNSNYVQLGVNDSIDRSTPVQEFSSSTNWKQVSVGYYHTAAIKTDGTLWAWGRNNYGQLGVNDNLFSNRSTPVQEFTSSINWKYVGAGRYHTAAIKTDGTLWLWGSNGNGQLGVNDNITRSTPVQEFTSSTNWRLVSGGALHTVAIKTDGTLWTWGLAQNGVLGINDASTNRSTPVQEFTSSTNWIQVSAGHRQTLALKAPLFSQ